jgi:3-phenylpropionate/trans-cinnamate dioxygenase ferredoxin subunit
VPQRYVVAKAAEIPLGDSKAVTVANREIAIFNLGGDYFALLNRCPHAGGPLCQGRRTSLVESKRPGTFVTSRPGEMLRCPWHGWEFDIRTGRSYCDPDKVRARAYEAKVEPGQRVVEGPYTAETYPVALDEDYIVVEI